MNIKLRDKKIFETNKNKILLLIAIFLITMLFLSFFPDTSPLFRINIFSIYSTIQNNLHNPIPVSYFKNNAIQNPATVIDYPIDSSGCTVPLSIKTATSSYIEISSENSKRHFIVYLPKGYQNSVQHPLILAFHGYALNPFTFEKITHFNVLADKDNIILVYPEGSTSLVGLRGWNTGLHPTIRANDILYVSNMLNTLQSNLCINPHKIYATGFSDGGGFVAKLACQLSNRIAAFAPVSGSYVTAFNSCKAKRSLPVIEFHGTKDTIVPYQGLEKKKEFAALTWTRNWANIDDCKSQPIINIETNKITKYQWTDCSNNVSVIHYKIIGEGHAWPHVLFNERLNNHNIKVRVEVIIWNFFAKNFLP